MITYERLKEIVQYDPETGVFTWLECRKKCTPGSVAGSVRPDGYTQIRLDYKRYYAHRLAWLYMTGQHSDKIVDHADGNPRNNAWRNLREATPAQSAQNRGVQKNNRDGVKGVKRAGHRFYAMISAAGHNRYLGTFETQAEAIAAYAAAARHYHGEFARL